MAIHSDLLVNKLTGKLKERVESLATAMNGSPLNTDEISRSNFPETYRSVAPDDVRMAVDDFATILKEIRTTLGKNGGK